MAESLAFTYSQLHDNGKALAILKVGNSAVGSAATLAHTGSMTHDAATYPPEVIAHAAELGINGFEHRRFLNSFYVNRFPDSFARGVPFQDNPRTLDCRISGTTASLCGLEDGSALAVARILLAHSVTFSTGGIPLLYLGDEVGQLNDYDYPTLLRLILILLQLTPSLPPLPVWLLLRLMVTRTWTIDSSTKADRIDVMSNSACDNAPTSVTTTTTIMVGI